MFRVRVVALNAIVLASGLILLELMFGGWLTGDGIPLYVLRDFNIEYDCSGLYPGCRTIDYSRDHWGLRGGDGDPSHVQILTVGGSTTDQRYVPLPRTWQVVLAAELERARGRRAIVANAGIDGMSTVGHLDALEHWIPRIPGLRPALAVYMIGINDRRLPAADPHDGTLQTGGWVAEMKQQSALIGLGRVLRGMLRTHEMGLPMVGHMRRDVVDLTPEPDLDLKVKQFSDREHDRLVAYGHRLQEIARLTRQRLGAEPVFVTQVTALLQLANPPLVSRSEEENAVSVAAFNRVTLETCALVKATCIDLSGHVAFAKEDFYDGYHNTPSGAEKIGRLLAVSLPVQ